MKTPRVFLTILLAGAFNLGAQEPSDPPAQTPVKESFSLGEGYSLVSEKETERGTWDREVKTSAGLGFSIESARELSPEAQKKILRALEIFTGWKNLQIRELKFLTEGDDLSISLVPSSFTLQGKALETQMPSGFFFQWQQNLEYNFRVSQSGILLRISGLFTTVRDLEDKLLLAVQNPALYLQKNDPDFLFKKVSELSTLNEQMLSQMKIIDQKYAEAQKAFDQAVAENQFLRRALMAYVNKDFFGGIHPLDPQEVEKLLDLKKKNPKAAKDLLIPMYKTAGGKLSDYEINLVLAVYFGEL